MHSVVHYHTIHTYIVYYHTIHTCPGVYQPPLKACLSCNTAGRGRGPAARSRLCHHFMGSSQALSALLCQRPLLRPTGPAPCSSCRTSRAQPRATAAVSLPCAAAIELYAAPPPVYDALVLGPPFRGGAPSHAARCGLLHAGLLVLVVVNFMCECARHTIRKAPLMFPVPFAYAIPMPVFTPSNTHACRLSASRRGGMGSCTGGAVGGSRAGRG